MEYQSIKYNNQWTQLLLQKLGGLIKKSTTVELFVFYRTSNTDVNCKKLQTYKPLPVVNILLVLNY